MRTGFRNADVLGDSLVTSRAADAEAAAAAAATGRLTAAGVL